MFPNLAAASQEGGQDLAELLPIPPDVSTAYDAVRSEVAARVDAALFRRPDLGVLLGDSSASTVRELNRYLSAFLGSVLTLGLPELVTDGLPRMLGGYRSRGVSFDYMEALPTLWRGALGDQLGPRGRPIDAVLEWMDSHPDAWIPEVEASGPRPGSGEDLRLCEALLAGDGPGARSVVQNFLRQGASLPRVFVELIQPALYEIGRRWEDGRISAAQEHLASALVSRLLAGMGDEGPAPGTERVVVVTTAPTETHEFGAWMAADILREEGWTVHFLGSQLPAEETLHFVRSVRPDLLAISVTLEIHLPSLRALIQALRQDSDLADVPVLVGGQAFGASDRVWRRTGADARAQDVRHLVAEAERLVRG